MLNNGLKHHGIKGQKWGVRRYQNKDGSLTNAGKKRYDDEYDEERERLEQEVAARRGVKYVRKTKKEREAEDAENERKENERRVKEDAAYKRTEEKMKEVDKKLQAKYDFNSSEDVDKYYKKYDEEWFKILYEERKKEGLTHSDLSTDEFYHHGIKGQKWGVRRFQNKDGSLTPAGEKRYYVESDKREVVNDSKSTTVPKGYKFNRVGGAKLDVNKSGALYVSSGKADATRYMRMLGPTPLSKLLGNYATHVQHIEVIDDLKKASPSETTRISVDILSKNPKMAKEINDSIHAMAAGVDFDQKALQKAKDNPNSKEAKKIALAVSAVLGDSNNYGKEANMIYEAFRQNGYDAIPDFNDTLTGRSETATIIINPKKVRVTSTTEITKNLMKEGKNYLKKLADLPLSDIFDEDEE